MQRSALCIGLLLISNIMIHPLRSALAFFVLVTCPVAVAQHCAAISESYLSEISVKKSRGNLRHGELKFKLEYTMQGGHGQNAFQAYLLVYLERDATRVPAPAPKDVIDTNVALVLHTQLIKRNKDGTFDMEFQINEKELAKKMIAHRRLTGKDRADFGDWGVYKDHLRIAVFVPWLEDKKYSVIDGLPKDRHCCNYGDARVLLFQTLPYRLSIHFVLGKTGQVDPGKLRININGVMTPMSNWPPRDEKSTEGDKPGSDDKDATGDKPPTSDK